MFQVHSLQNKLTMENSPTAEYSGYMPDTDEIYSWAEDLVNMGARKPGTKAWETANAYVSDKLTAFGLENVKTIKSDTTLWECDTCTLTIGSENISVYGMAHTFVTGKDCINSTPDGGINAEIVYVGDGDERDFEKIDVEGKIVVANIDFEKLPIGLSGLISYLTYDPNDEIGLFTTLTNPYSANTYPYNYYYAQQNGAVAFIGILEDYYNSSIYNNEDYSYMGGMMQIPGAWISPEGGEKIIKLIKNGENEAVFNMSVSSTPVEAGAVIGTLPGNSDETIIVQSHYDSSTPGGAEDASGTADVLALAKFYSQIPAEKRERTLMFVLMDTHFNDYESHDAFIAEYLGEGHNIVADVCVEHIANEGKIDDNGNLYLTGKSELKLFFVNDIDALTTITTEEIVRHKLAKTVVLPAYLFDEVPSDADMIYQEGVPIVSMITAPIYLYDNCDTVEMIAKDDLKPTAETFADIIWRIAETPSSEL